MNFFIFEGTGCNRVPPDGIVILSGGICVLQVKMDKTAPPGLEEFYVKGITKVIGRCMLTEMLGKAGVMPGAIEIVTGRGAKVGSWLCGNKDVHAITLTGSTEVGIETAKTAADHLAHIALELGGNDAFIVLEDGDVDLAVEELIWGCMYNTGQVCCASKRCLIQRNRVGEFTEKAVERISRLKQGMPSDESTQIGCLISEKAAIEVEKQIQLTVEQGGRIVLGGTRNGAFIAPTVIADVPKTADVATDMEIFGPVVPIIVELLKCQNCFVSVLEGRHGFRQNSGIELSDISHFS